jgi:hypothetical protein
MNVIHRLTLGSLLAATLAFISACPGNEAQPPVADTGNETDPGDGSSSGASADESGTESGGEACVEEPADPVGILNQCTDATCEPFANTPERLPRLQADGSLPPLP